MDVQINSPILISRYYVLFLVIYQPDKNQLQQTLILMKLVK